MRRKFFVSTTKLDAGFQGDDSDDGGDKLQERLTKTIRGGRKKSQGIVDVLFPPLPFPDSTITPTNVVDDEEDRTTKGRKSTVMDIATKNDN